jgi:hypothetical protein
MATLNEIAFNILNTLSGGRSEEDKNLSIDQVKFYVQYYRSLILRRELRPHESANEFSQFLPNIEMEIITKESSRKVELPTPFLKSTKPIPPTVRLRGNRSGLLSVTSLDLDESFSQIAYNHHKWTKHNKYTSNTPRAFLHNNWDLYISSDSLTNYIADQINQIPTEEDPTKGICAVEIEGVFEDPEEAFEFAYDRPMDHDKDRYPIAGDTIQRVTQSILSGEGRMVMGNVYNPSREAIEGNRITPNREANFNDSQQ